jgi:DNA-binding NarL/FixJ family response regulator
MTVGTRSTLAGRRLLLVDVQLVFGEVLRLRLEPMGCHIRTVQTIDRARVELRADPPDLILAADELDRGANGLDLLTDLVDTDAHTRLLVMSEAGEARDVVNALDHGAAGWLLKEDSVIELVDACVSTLAGETYLSHGIVRPVIEHLLRCRHEETFVSALSDREREVLGCLVAGLDRQQVAARLYVSPNTVRTHIQNLLRAADVHSTIALVSAARAAGVETPSPSV